MGGGGVCVEIFGRTFTYTKDKSLLIHFFSLYFYFNDKQIWLIPRKQPIFHPGKTRIQESPPATPQPRAYLFSDSLGKQSCLVDYYRIQGLYENEENNKMVEHGRTCRSIYKDGLIELYTHFIAFEILFLWISLFYVS